MNGDGVTLIHGHVCNWPESTRTLRSLSRNLLSREREALKYYLVIAIIVHL